jgi:hypothetical protein
MFTARLGSAIALLLTLSFGATPAHAADNDEGPLYKALKTAFCDYLFENSFLVYAADEEIDGALRSSQAKLATYKKALAAYKAGAEKGKWYIDCDYSDHRPRRVGGRYFGRRVIVSASSSDDRLPTPAECEKYLGEYKTKHRASERQGQFDKSDKKAIAAMASAEVGRTLKEVVAVMERCKEGSANVAEANAGNMKSRFYDLKCAVRWATLGRLLPATEKFEGVDPFNNNKYSYTFASLQKEMPEWEKIARDPAKVFAERAKVLEEKDAARWGAHYKALKDDKLALFKKECKGRAVCEIYAKGGRLMKTPKDFVKAAVWIPIAGQQTEFPYKWTAHVYTFKGHKQVNVVDRTGTSASFSVPASAYK